MTSCGNPPPTAVCSAGKNDAPAARRCSTMRASRSVSADGGGPGGRKRWRWSVRNNVTRPSRSPSGSTPTQTTSPAEMRRSEIGGRVALDARGQNLALELGGRNRRALDRLDRIEDRVEAAATWPGDRLPRQREPAERGAIDRLHLFPQPRQRALPQCAQDIGAAPFALEAARPELALHDAARGGKPRQRLLDDGDAKTESRRAGYARERPVRPGVALHQVADRVGHRFQKRVRQPLRQRCAEGVAVSCRVLDCDEPRCTCDGDRDDAACGDELVDRAAQRRRCDPRRDLVARQIPNRSSRSCSPSIERTR